MNLKDPISLDEYILALQDLREKEGGEIYVVSYAPFAPMGAVRTAAYPKVCFVKTKSSRETYTKVCGVLDEPSGEKVILV